MTTPDIEIRRSARRRRTISARREGDRLIVIEDTAELQSASDNTVFMRCSDGVPIQRLVKVSMRYRPTRILVGEVRDALQRP